MPFPTSAIDGPPPNPVTDPSASRETGQPMPNAPAGGAGVAGLASPIAPQPQGSDMSGVNTLGTKIAEACLALAQAAPQIGPDLEAAAAMIQNALGKLGAQASSQPGVTGQAVTQAGPQFPGGGQGAGKPF